MNPFDLLYQELDQWNFEGEQAVFWWRDDDAQKNHPSLLRLVDLAGQYDVPLALAVIPAGSEHSLRELTERNPDLSLLQHGYQHQNHASKEEKKQELGAHREHKLILVELQKGFDMLKQVAGARMCPVLVPPWNRISTGLFPDLSKIGFKGISCFGARKQPLASDDLWIVNTHVDIIQWRPEKRFIGEKAAIDQLLSHLRDKRLDAADRAEPTGLLTHHLVHDEECWLFLKKLLSALDEHPAVTWLAAERVFQTRWR
jgi:hypothetical protein